MLQNRPFTVEWKSNFARLISLTSKSSPELFARRIVLSLYKRLPNISLPIDLKDIGSILDVKKISYKPLPDGIDSMLLPFPDGYAIEINSNVKSESRKRFSCCHEFAHILIERYFSTLDLDNYAFSINTATDYREEELLCQKIAAEILIPYNNFRAKALEWNPSIESIYALSKEFKASFPSILRRLMASKIWKFGFVHWYIKEDTIHSVKEMWHVCGSVPKQLITNIEDSPHLFHTYWTRKDSKEIWSGYSIEHKSLTENDVISFIW